LHHSTTPATHHQHPPELLQQNSDISPIHTQQHTLSHSPSDELQRTQAQCAHAVAYGSSQHSQQAGASHLPPASVISTQGTPHKQGLQVLQEHTQGPQVLQEHTQGPQVLQENTQGPQVLQEQELMRASADGAVLMYSPLPIVDSSPGGGEPHNFSHAAAGSSSASSPTSLQRSRYVCTCTNTHTHTHYIHTHAHEHVHITHLYMQPPSHKHTHMDTRTHAHIHSFSHLQVILKGIQALRTVS
jgi:hypothetical protein